MHRWRFRNKKGEVVRLWDSCGQELVPGCKVRWPGPGGYAHGVVCVPPVTELDEQGNGMVLVETEGGVKYPQEVEGWQCLALTRESI